MKQYISHIQKDEYKKMKECIVPHEEWNEANPSHDGTPNYNIQSKTISNKGIIRIYL